MGTSNQPQSTLRYAGLATQWLVMLLIAVFGGIELDKKIKWGPVCTILFPLIALILLLWQVIKEFSKPKK
jgi:hypothetical protein